MHHLTIEHDATSVTISEHRDYGDAHRTLWEYVIGADYYLHPVQIGDAHSRYELMRLLDEDTAEHRRGPAVIGTATIAEHRLEQPPVPSPYTSACEAQRWLDDHALKWEFGSDTDPGYRYPMAVLHTAHAEAHYLLRAGTLLPEAAHLAGVDVDALPHRDDLEALRRNAISIASPAGSRTPGALAAAVQRQLPSDTDDHHTAALIWWTALLIWGATTP